MSQNTSSAVMQQRKEPSDSLDLFPTPPWATRALCEWLSARFPIEAQTVWEPACGHGDMVLPLREYFSEVFASDVYAHSPGVETFDFLMMGEPLHRPDWIITNPPFRLAEKFIERACATAKVGVAMLVRLAFVEGTGRYERLFSKNKPVILQFTERVAMVKGRVDQDASSATAYCWMVWLQDQTLLDAIFAWIPPCRKRLEHEGDYT